MFTDASAQVANLTAVFVCVNAYNAEGGTMLLDWEDRTPIGTFSSVFTSKIQSSLIALARSGGASIVDRLK